MAEYADPSELSPIGDEELFTTQINMMVAEDAPRLFALCEEIGDRVDAVMIALGIAFENHAEVVSATRNGMRGVFGSPNAPAHSFRSTAKPQYDWYGLTTYNSKSILWSNPGEVRTGGCRRRHVVDHRVF